MTRPPRIVALSHYRPSLGYLPSERRAAQAASDALDEIVRGHGPLARKAGADAARVLSACLHAAHMTAAFSRHGG